MAAFRLRSFSAALLLGTCVSLAGTARAATHNLADLSLDELMNEPVTSVSKKETRLRDSATAITVITPEELRRLGITTIPEALRLVPGFDVARIDASHWAVSSRGFNQQYASTLLVLIDGRSVYTPAFGGVYWDSQDVELADLERIEVIRGPGATLWGANAVNGVVNVITRRAADTQGAFLAGSLGSEDRPALEGRYGGALGDTLHYRVFAKAFERAGFDSGTGETLPNDWSSVRAGGRADWEPSADRTLSVQGEYYAVQAEHSRLIPTFTPPYSSLPAIDTSTRAFDVLAKWTQAFADGSSWSLQGYVDSYDRYEESRDTFDVELVHRFALGARNDIVWGGGYRFSRDTMSSQPPTMTTPASRGIDLYTAFAQDDITLVPSRWRLTIGTKLEHNDFTGVEVQPSMRMLWTPVASTSAWVAISRAVSTPSRFYNDMSLDLSTVALPNAPLAQVSLVPNRNLPAQTVLAYELGVRVEPAESLSVDLATFLNQYRHLYAPVRGAPVFELEPVPHLTIPIRWDASLSGQSYGVELSLNYKPLDSWRLAATYAWLSWPAKAFEGSVPSSPEQQASLRSYLTLSSRFELNAAVYYVDAIRSLTLQGSTIAIPSYLRVDTGLVYRPLPWMELGLWGQNLGDARHTEITGMDTGLAIPVPRSVLARLTARF